MYGAPTILRMKSTGGREKLEEVSLVNHGRHDSGKLSGYFKHRQLKGQEPTTYRKENDDSVAVLRQPTERK